MFPPFYDLETQLSLSLHFRYSCIKRQVDMRQSLGTNVFNTAVRPIQVMRKTNVCKVIYNDYGRGEITVCSTVHMNIHSVQDRPVPISI